MIVTTLVLLAVAALIGLWLLWRFLTTSHPHPAVLISHAVFGWVGVVIIGVLFSLGRNWEVTLYQEGTVAGFVLAGLFGILQGLIRLARRGTSTLLIALHVGCALIGFAFLWLIVV